MKADMLTTATLTGDVLSSSVPMTTDGLPEWHDHPGYGRTRGPGDGCSCPAVGVFPVTVGVVESVRQCIYCLCFESNANNEGCSNNTHSDGKLGHHLWRRVDAVTVLVEVTGPSHHAEDCTYSPGDPMGNYAGPLCHPDAAPDGWHTPVRVVERLDTPEPVDVPTELRCVHCHRAPDAAPTIHADARCSAKSTGHDTWRVPAVWWVPA